MFNLKLYRSILNLNTGNRLYSNANSDILPVLTNRNPRNLEKMRIAYKPNGYYLEKPGRSYWHKLKLDVSQRHVTASVEHYLNGEVLTASTREWALKKQLYRTYDKAAFVNVGRVLAQRCLEAGLTEIRCDILPKTQDGKISGFLDSLKNSGISLEEPDQFKPIRPWDLYRPEKPWETE